MRLQKVLVVSDAHHPYVDKRAWQLLLKVARATKPDVLVTIGDFLDLYAVSSFAKDPTRKNMLQEEIEAGNLALDELDALRWKRKVFLMGNHEVRYESYLKKHAPELFTVTNIPRLLSLKERGYECVRYMDYIRIGEISFTHDVGRSGKYAAHQTLSDFGDNIVFGHSHRLSVVYGGTAAGKPHVSLNVGWLGDSKEIDYTHKAKVNRDWQLGFGVVYLAPNGVAHAQAVPIVNYTCVVEGRLYRG
jgi:predicted phosphodiesterase